MRKKPRSSKPDIALLKHVNAMLNGILNDEYFVGRCLDKLLEEADVEWEKCYEYAPQKLRKVLIKCFNPEWLATISTKDAFAELVNTGEFTDEQLNFMRSPEISLADMRVVLLASAYDLECLSRHGVHMHDLLKSAANGNDKAIFRAMEIDPAVANCKALQRRLKRARASMDSDFIKEFKNRLEWRASKHQLHRKKVRLILEILDDDQQQLSLKELHALLVETGTLSPADGPDNLKTLMANRLKEKKELKS